MRYTELVILSTLCWGGVTACTGDNCLRALQGNAASASAFRATYTASLVTASTSFPNFLSPCSASGSKLTSACTCFAGVTTTSTRSSTIATASASSTSSPSSCTGTTITVTPSTCALATTYTSISIVTSLSIATSTITVTDNATLSGIVTITDDITIPPSTITDSVVVTTTQDVVVTTTVQVETEIDCWTSIAGNGCYRCQYIVSCDMVYQNSATEYQATITPNFSACLALCDSSTNCFTVDYQKSTGNCTLFSNGPVTGDGTTFTANSDFDVGEYNGLCKYPNGPRDC